MVSNEMVAVRCKEGTKTFQVDKRICNMSPLFSDMLDEFNEQASDEVITLDFASEEAFSKALEFCEKSGYSTDRSDMDNLPRRLLAKPEIMRIEDLFVTNQTDAILQDETWKVPFFKAMELSEIVKLANLANYLNIP